MAPQRITWRWIERELVEIARSNGFDIIQGMSSGDSLIELPYHQINLTDLAKQLEERLTR